MGAHVPVLQQGPVGSQDGQAFVSASERVCSNPWGGATGLFPCWYHHLCLPWNSFVAHLSSCDVWCMHVWLFSILSLAAVWWWRYEVTVWSVTGCCRVQKHVRSSHLLCLLALSLVLVFPWRRKPHGRVLVWCTHVSMYHSAPQQVWVHLCRPCFMPVPLCRGQGLDRVHWLVGSCSASKNGRGAAEGVVCWGSAFPSCRAGDWI